MIPLYKQQQGTLEALKARPSRGYADNGGIEVPNGSL